jgi:hypothetical protein
LLVECRNCGTHLGESEATGCITMAIRFYIPVFVFAFAFPIARGLLQKVPFARCWPVIVGMLLIQVATL